MISMAMVSMSEEVDDFVKILYSSNGIFWTTSQLEKGARGSLADFSVVVFFMRS